MPKAQAFFTWHKFEETQLPAPQKKKKNKKKKKKKKESTCTEFFLKKKKKKETREYTRKKKKKKKRNQHMVDETRRFELELESGKTEGVVSCNIVMMQSTKT